MTQKDQIVTELREQYTSPDEELLEEAADEAENLVEDIDESSVDVDVLGLAQDMYDYIEHQVSVDEARKSIIRNLATANDVDVSNVLESDSGEGMSEVTVDQITEDDTFYTVNVQIGELWDDHSDAMSQKGIAYDETGSIIFKSWEKSQKPLLTQGQSYRLKGVASDEYQGNMSISINSQTEIEMIDEEFEEPTNDKEYVGALVSVRSGSGLIERCTEEDCTRVLSDGSCAEHGDIEGEFDLRVKAVLDNGETTQDIIVGKELTESITGISLEEAEQIAKDALDTDAVTDEVADEVFMKYYKIEGWETSYDDIIAEKIEEYDNSEDTNVEELVGRLNSLQTNTFDQTEVN